MFNFNISKIEFVSWGIKWVSFLDRTTLALGQSDKQGEWKIILVSRMTCDRCFCIANWKVIKNFSKQILLLCDQHKADHYKNAFVEEIV